MSARRVQEARHEHSRLRDRFVIGGTNFPSAIGTRTPSGASDKQRNGWETFPMVSNKMMGACMVVAGHLGGWIPME